jgi:hypothetical protein
MTTEADSKSRVVRWIDKRLPIFALLRQEIDEYPTVKMFTDRVGDRPAYQVSRFARSAGKDGLI